MNWISVNDELPEGECFRCLQCQLAGMTWIEGRELMKKPKPLPIKKIEPPEDK